MHYAQKVQINHLLFMTKYPYHLCTTDQKNEEQNITSVAETVSISLRDKKNNYRVVNT